jgi:regulator of protease activity HflC (stomatin/prohibitin superfamily)
MYDFNQLHALAYGHAHRPAFRPGRLLPWTTEVVAEHEFALLYTAGRFVRLMTPGLHRLWGRHQQVVRLDRRRQLLEVPAQELPTADGVTVKVTAQVTWSITDPVAAVQRDADHRQTLYAAAQQAVRSALAVHPLAGLAAQRAAIAVAMREAVAGAVAGIGLVVHNAALKDIMPNAETRKAMAAVAFAKAEALAALEKARGEQAALRALANAARLVRDQPELAQVRSMQVLAEGLRGGASVVVNTGAGAVIPVRAAT